jgi:hypothetical protein
MPDSKCIQIQIKWLKGDSIKKIRCKKNSWPCPFNCSVHTFYFKNTLYSTDCIPLAAVRDVLPVHMYKKAVLRIRDVYPGFRIRIFSIPDPGVKKIPGSGTASASKNLSILTQKCVSKLSEISSGMFIPDPDLDFLPIPDPEIKKTPDPGSGSAILKQVFLIN